MKKTLILSAVMLLTAVLYGANVTVDNTTPLHPYQRDAAFGINFLGEWWDYSLYNANIYRFQEAGTRFLRFPGGSNSNEYHWNGNGAYDANKIWNNNGSPDVTTFSRGFYNLAAHRGSLSAGYGKWAMVTDGDMTTSWMSYPDDPFEQWIYLDVETSSSAAVPFTSVVIDWATPYATQFKVQYSSGNWNGLGQWMYNDTAWTDTSAGVVAGTGGETTVNFNSVTAKYVRILMLSSSDVHNQYAINEIRVYNGTTQITKNEADVGQTPSVSSSVALGDNFQNADTMDFEEFMSACRSMTPTAIPLITINFYTGTTQEAADWVYYANINKGYNIKHWEIGNENAGTWEAGGPSLPEAYARRYILFYDAMLAVDPTINVVPQFNSITDPCNVTMNASNNPAGNDYYIDTFLKYMANNGRSDILANLKGISVHKYPTYEPATESVALGQVDLWNSDLPLLKSWVNNRCSNPSQVKTYLTECNDGIDSGFTNHFYNSLFVTAFFLNYLRNGGDYASFFVTFGTPGPGQNDKTIFSDFGYLEGGGLGGALASKMYQPRSSFYALDMLYNDFSAADSFGNTLLTASSDNTALKVYADRRGDRKLTIALINTDNTNTITANISINGFTPLGSADFVSYDTGDYNWVANGAQSYASPDNPPEHSQLTGVSANFSYNIEPYSIKMITMYDASQATLVPSATPTMLPTATISPTPLPNGGVLVDDCEHAGVRNYWGGTWSIYGDGISSYPSVLNSMTCNGLGAAGSNCHVDITGTVAANSWGFGVNCPLNPSWTGTDISMYDGVFFYYRGDGAAARLAFVQTDMPDSNYGANIPDTTGWVYYTIPFSSLTHASWGAQTGTWTAKNIEAIQFQPAGAPSGSSAYRELDADYVGFYKNTPTSTQTPTATIFSTGTITPTATMTPAVTATSTAVVSAASSNLDNVYVYPAYFNQSLGNSSICFYRLTNHARLAIYNLKGELVYADTSTDTSGTLCVQIAGQRKYLSLASGIYIYVVSNESQMKKGKIAIIR
jgi:hypothetical protein